MMEAFDLLLTRDGCSHGSIDALPEQVIGIILSHVASARDIARASMTCRKFCEAVRHHLHKLTFVKSDVCTRDGRWVLEGKCEVIISEAIFKMSCLEELSICMENSFQFQAGSVIAWLLYTKMTLKSLKFMNKVHPRVNILEKLGGGTSKLQHLEWSFAYLPKLDVGTQIFPCLVSLTLRKVQDVMGETLQALLIACPKLESLSLKYFQIRWSHVEDRDLQRTLSLECFSLRKLQIVGGLGAISQIILLANCLKTLTVTGGSFTKVKLIQDKGCSSFQSILIKKAYIAHLELGDSVDSLYKVQLSGFENLEVEWIKYFPIISRANNLRILRLCGASSTYRGTGLQLCGASLTYRDTGLWLCGDSLTYRDTGLHDILISFPCLYLLALDYHCCKTLNLNGSSKSLTLNNVVVLELSSHKMDGEFATWIGLVLKQCYNLQRLRVSAPVPPFIGGHVNKPMSSFVASMVQIMRPYQHINLQFKFC